MPPPQWQSEAHIHRYSSGEHGGTLSSHSSSTFDGSHHGSKHGTGMAPSGQCKEEVASLDPHTSESLDDSVAVLPTTQSAPDAAQEVSAQESIRPSTLKDCANGDAWHSNFHDIMVWDPPRGQLVCQTEPPAAEGSQYHQLWQQLAYTLALQVAVFDSQVELWSTARTTLLHNNLLLQHSKFQPCAVEQPLPLPPPVSRLRSLLRLLAGVAEEGHMSDMDALPQLPGTGSTTAAAITSITSSPMPDSPFASAASPRTGSFLQARRGSGGGAGSRGSEPWRGLATHLSLHASSVASLAQVRLSHDSTTEMGNRRTPRMSPEANNGALSGSRVGSRGGSYEGGGSGSFVSLLLSRHSRIAPAAEPPSPPPPLAWPNLARGKDPSSEGPASRSGRIFSPSSPQPGGSGVSASGRLLSRSFAVKQQDARTDTAEAGGQSPPGSCHSPVTPRSARSLNLSNPPHPHPAPSQLPSDIHSLPPDPAFAAPSQLLLKSSCNLSSEVASPMPSPSAASSAAWQIRAPRQLLLRPPRPPSASSASSRPKSATSVHAAQSRLSPQPQPHIAHPLSVSMPMLAPANGTPDASTSSPRSSPALD
jgi:hypothetical protein